MTQKNALKFNAALQAAALISVALMLGFSAFFGTIGPAAATLFLSGSVLIFLFRQCYHLLVFTGVLLLSCVFIEPSPSDLILCGVIPLGLLTGVYQPKIQKNALVAVLLLLSFFIACLPSIASSSDLNASLRYFLITFYLFLIAVFICTYPQGKKIILLIRAYILAAFLSFLAGLAGYLGFFSELLMADAFRVKGMFKDPNVFGPFFVPAIVILLNDRKQKVLLKTPGAVHLLVILMLSLGVIFSFSRGAWINLAVSLFLYAALNLRLHQIVKHWRAIASTVFVLVLAAGIFFSPLLNGTGIREFLAERAQIQDYDSNRFNAQRGGLRLMIQNPLGCGPGQFEDEIARVTKYRLSAHSLYIRTAAENGVAAFLLFFFALAYLLASLLRSHFLNRKRPSRGKTQICPPPCVTFAVLGGILVNSLVVDTMHWRHLWFFIGIGLLGIRQAQEVQRYD